MRHAPAAAPAAPVTSCPNCRASLDADARCPACTPERLVHDNIARAFWAAQKAWRRGGPVRRLGSVEDAGQEAVLLMMRATRNYRPARGVKFGTYAAKMIILELGKSGCASGLVRAPIALAFLRDDGRPLKAGLAKGYSGCLKEARAALAPPCQLPGKFLPGEALAARTSNPADEAADNEERAVMTARVRTALHTLPAGWRRVVEQRFGLAGNEKRRRGGHAQPHRGKAQTLGEIGERLGVSRERVRQIEEKALVRLYKRLKKAGAHA